MSDDGKNPHLSVDDEISAECTESSGLDKSVAMGTTVGSSKEESSAPVLGGGVEEEASAPVLGGGVEEEAPAGAVGGEEESTAGNPLQKPKVSLGIEDLQQAFLVSARSHLSQFQSIKDDLVETIKDLKLTARRNPGNWEIFERLREHLNEAYECLEEIKEAMTVTESREQYMTSQINQFFEMRREAGENFEGISLNVGSVEGFDVSIQTANRSPGAAEENIDRSKIAIAVVDQMLQGARLRRRMREMGAGTKEVAAAIEMEGAGRVAEEPGRVEGVTGRANAAEEREDQGRLRYPPVTGKYTLAITAHQLYPESLSSDDSPVSEPTQHHQGAVEGAPQPLQVRDVDVDEEIPEENSSQDKSSSDSPNKESRQH